ncbi:MAG: tetratricopeptide repeat protein [Terrimicrobiaceae bacterium]
MKTALLLFAAILAVTFPLQAQTSSPSGSRESRALLQSALADFDAKNYDAALKKLQELDVKLPDDAFVQNLLGAAYTKKKDYETAQKYFDKALVKQPDFFPAKFNVGELLFLQRRYAEALDFFEKMLAKDPRNELLQFKVFLCQLQLGNKDEAAKALKAIKYPGDTPAWYYGQAAWESKNGNNKKAIEYLTGAHYIFGPKTALFDETFEDLGIKLR